MYHLLLSRMFNSQNGYFPGFLIGSGGPQSNEEDLFWEMIFVKKCLIVVAMEKLVRYT